jgi:3-oxoacyl-[acyl-carrier-protein] synthase-1
MREKGLRGVGAMAVPKTMASTVSASVATGLKIGGVSYSIASACATSTHCVGHAMELIQLGKQDIVIAGGGEQEDWTQACMFDGMGAMSTQYNDKPQLASRPYDADRDGFVIAGGGGMVVVESLDSAKRRGATILAEIVGYGASSDGADMVAPSGVGAVNCMKQALKQAGLNSVDYINTHGTSTPIGDITELEAIRQVFGSELPPISSTKSMTGHSLGAVGVQELIYCLLMLNQDFIAPNINIENLDEKATDFDIVRETRPVDLNTIMTNSFGFGGTNASLIIKKFVE